MKKFTFIFFAILMLTGCGTERITCTSSKTLEDYYKVNETVTFKFNGEKITKVNMVQSLTFDETYIKENNLNLEEVKKSYTDSFKESYDGVKGLKYFIESKDNTLSVSIKCSKKCVNNYMNYSKKTKEDILNNYNKDADYTCK